ncbi:MAG: glycyl-radical enzyme activating protein, partial [bacterium]|nr:glycyl-radical enzyme activating protein [bacterium]
SQRFERQLYYGPILCIGCGACAQACPEGCHRLENGVHAFDRAACRLCLECAGACPSGAIELVGRAATVEELLAEIEKGRVYYDESGGGLTLSGGEPLAHFAFTRDLLTAARGRGLHTCVETCGFGPAGRFIEIVPLVDLFLWDLKDTDATRHEANTGAPLAPILANLRAVDASGCATVLRCILLAGVNLEDAHIRRIGEIAAELRHCGGVELLAYHSLGASKRERLGLPPQNEPALAPTPAQMDAARAWLRREFGLTVK